jgi:hypothetical protein
MQSGQLDDAIPLLAFSGITACSEIDELNRLVQSFDHIANMMYFMDPSRSKLPLRAAVQLIKASYAHLSDDIRGIKHRHVSNLSSLLYYFSRDVREFLSEQQIIHGDCLAECLRVAHFAALSLSQERQLYEDAARLPWRQAFYKTPFQALRIAQNICGTFGDIDLPEFEHGSLNHVIPVLESLVYSRKIVARAMYERMVSPTNANTKTIVAHLGRRFKPFREYVFERGPTWATLLQAAMESTTGDELDRLCVRHNVAYCGAMYGDDEGMIEDIRSIEVDSARMEALVDMNLLYGRNNLRRLLAMLSRKAIAPPKEEQFVREWAAVLFKRVRKVAEARHLL